MPPRDPPALDAATVGALADQLGYPPLAADTAARIAAGAAAAVAAVRATATVSLFDREPGQFLAELERLADGAP